eukprot:CAMPEP_0174259822 /NCGR_PEP_ID=MMETSP0439-20130205/8607_1 /TAXON_ID=0 /ORGANISM="Stereomyxa ramosa, Strain Chinc5" /LENGTH=84 /DNA_ID=CAMNT_0015343875 /DNA_START=58 /DNA_END=309 /DNA_ORIENTATION=-
MPEEAKAWIFDNKHLYATQRTFHTVPQLVAFNTLQFVTTNDNGNTNNNDNNADNENGNTNNENSNTDSDNANNNNSNADNDNTN